MKLLRSILQAAKYLPIYIVCIAGVALMWQRPLTLTIIYAATGIGLLLWRHSSADLIYFFVPFFLGPAGEFFAVRQGAWSYNGVHDLPIWLPFVWGIAGLFMKNVIEALTNKEGSRISKSTAVGSWSDERFRSVVSRAIVSSIAIWVFLLLIFIGYNLLVPTPLAEGWLLGMIQRHYAALIQVPALALAAFFGVTLCGVVSGEPIEFKALGLEFRGASGPVILSVIVFLALVLATYLLWRLESG